MGREQGSQWQGDHFIGCVQVTESWPHLFPSELPSEVFCGTWSTVAEVIPSFSPSVPPSVLPFFLPQGLSFPLCYPRWGLRALRQLQRGTTLKQLLCAQCPGCSPYLLDLASWPWAVTFSSAPGSRSCSGATANGTRQCSLPSGVAAVTRSSSTDWDRLEGVWGQDSLSRRCPPGGLVQFPLASRWSPRLGES